MSLGIILIWLLVFLSGTMLILSRRGILKEWPKVPTVTLISNISILLLFYSPLYGHIYYLINIIKIAPLIMILVYLASKDPSPVWSYRAMCWIFISQLTIHSVHIMLDLKFQYYDVAALITTALEFAVIICGGLNVRLSFMDKSNYNRSGTKNSNTWARSHIKS